LSVCLFVCQVYRNQCICRLASVLTESCHTTSREIEIQTDSTQKCSLEFGFPDKDAYSVRQIDYKPCRMVGFDNYYPAGGIQSSITKFRFEDNRPVEVCDEWYYTIHYLKSMVNNVEELLNDSNISSIEDTNGLNWFARPYHYTKDDIIDIRRLQSPDKRIHSSVTDYDIAGDETCTRISQKYCEKTSVDIDISADRFPSNADNSALDKFLASTALATLCTTVPFHCGCRDLLQHGTAAELFPYLDAKTFYSRLVTGLGQSQHSLHVLHCDTVSQSLVMDSSGLLNFDNREDPRLLSAGTSVDLTPGGNGDKQKLPNIDQLRAIQDNLAYNVCHVLTFCITVLWSFFTDPL